MECQSQAQHVSSIISSNPPISQLPVNKPRSATNYWPNKSFIVIDTETTGLDFNEDRIIQLAIAVFYKSKHVHSFNWYSNDPKPSHPEALKVHQIEDEWRWEHGISLNTIMTQTVVLCRKMRDAGMPVLAFNAPFDFSMIRAECTRQNLSFPTAGLHIIDPITIDRHYQKNIPIFQAPWMRLNYMAARYGVSPPNHNAIDDAISAGYIAVAQSLHYPFIRKSYPLEIHRAQQQWFSEWCTKVRVFADKRGFDFNAPAWPFGDE